MDNGAWGYILEVIVISQLLTGHDALLASKECHAWFAGYNPLDHLAVRFARMVHETGDGAPSGIDDHILVERHEIVALDSVSALDTAKHDLR